jgi:2-polyprenyl-6-hydroxyphenyl methylase/3-demethylubiquinone-9 3-methyltransferase
MSKALLDTEKRFAFGENWRRFLSVLNDERIAVAENSLREMLEVESLRGKSFLDIGSGSGLFSLAAARLWAARIHSFDFDPASVACTQELKGRYFPQMDAWTIERGSALDDTYLAKLGQYDIVYSWGVLHHTGNMWHALEAVMTKVKAGGTIFIAIYNDRGWISRGWRAVKRVYITGRLGAALVIAIFVPFFAARGFAADVLRGRNPAARYRNYKKERGMSVVHDWMDWLGGYPYEVATPREIRGFYERQGFRLAKLRVRKHLDGNNEFVFTKPLE